MSEPTAEEGRIQVIMPFVRRWQLPLHPEGVDELASSVLLHAHSDRTVEEIYAAAEIQIDEHEQRARQP